MADSVGDAARQSDILISCLYSDALMETALGRGGFRREHAFGRRVRLAHDGRAVIDRYGGRGIAF